VKLLPVPILVAALALPVRAAPIFRNPQPIPLAAQSGQMLGGDFNNDGHDDVLIAEGTDKLAVYISNGTGPFAAPVISTAPGQFGRIATGDVNRDNKLDLVLTYQVPGSVTVMLGAGDGTFTQGSTFTAPARTYLVTVADFNGDAFPDVVASVSDYYSFDEPIHFYPGDGAGHFGSGVLIATNYNAASLTSADMTGDGKMDLLVNSDYGLRILGGNGDGTFTQKSLTPTGADVAVADFNHDNKLDVAVNLGGDYSPYLDVFPGNGDGTLQAPARYDVGADGTSIAAADLDADGNPDLLVASTYGSKVNVLRGKADGTFHPAQLFVSGPSTWTLLAGDYDRDGKLDVVTLDYNTELRALSFLHGNGDGTLRTERGFYGGVASSRNDRYLADMNHDDHLDAVVLKEHPHQNSASTYDAAVMLNDGTGKLAAPILTDSGRKSWGGGPTYALGDVNHDGHVDAVVLDDYAYTPSCVTMLGNGLGGFSAPIASPISVHNPPVLGNFTADTNLDLLIGAGDFADVYPGNGDGTFGAAIRSTVDARSVFAGDLNGDGKLDFVSGWIRSTVANINDGTGHFTPLPITNDEVTAAALGDFDGDGKLDLLITTYTGVQTCFGNGDGTFRAPVSFTIKPVPNYQSAEPTTTADVDGDGHLDVAFGTTVYLGNGDGTFRAQARFRTNGISSIAFGDLDGSGSPDLVVTKGAASDVDVLLTRTAPDPTLQTTTALTADRTTATYGQRITFTATVTGHPSTRVTGTVRFDIDGHPAGLVGIDNDGKAILYTGVMTGTHTVEAIYTGDEFYQTSTASMSVSISKAATTIDKSVRYNPQPAGRLVSITVSLSALSLYGFPAPSGVITVREGNTVLGTTPPWSGIVNYAWTSVGNHEVTIDYPGDANYEASTTSYTQQITKPVPSLVLALTPSTNIVAGSTVTLRASFPDAPDLTGTVSFYVDNVLRASVPISQAAAETQTTFDWGTHEVIAATGGDATWASSFTVRTITVYSGTWGSAPFVRATSSYVQWSRIVGATSYTLWRKTSAAAPWEAVGNYNDPASFTSVSTPANTTWLFAVTAKDASNNVSPMSAPDLATNVLLSTSNFIRAQHILELRTAVGAVRTFAGLPAFNYTNTIAAGSPIRATDVSELRTALNEARSAIGLSQIAFTDPVLTPGQTRLRSAHVLELRAGTD
jgi:hypothetical protein